MFTSISTIKNKRVQHLGIYTDLPTVSRVLKNIESFAGMGHKVHSVVEFKQQGVYNGRPSSNGKKAEKRDQKIS